MSINHVHIGLVSISAQCHLDGSFAHYTVPQRLIIIYYILKEGHEEE